VTNRCVVVHNVLRKLTHHCSCVKCLEKTGSLGAENVELSSIAVALRIFAVACPSVRVHARMELVISV
jgi:hypothetical protein